MTVAVVRERDAEKIAWGVLWSAFAVFLVLLFGIPTAVYWYLSTATDPHETSMTVLSGTVVGVGLMRVGPAVARTCSDTGVISLRSAAMRGCGAAGQPPPPA